MKELESLISHAQTLLAVESEGDFEQAIALYTEEFNSWSALLSSTATADLEILRPQLMELQAVHDRIVVRANALHEKVGQDLRTLRARGKGVLRYLKGGYPAPRPSKGKRW